MDYGWRTTEDPEIDRDKQLAGPDITDGGRHAKTLSHSYTTQPLQTSKRATCDPPQASPRGPADTLAHLPPCSHHFSVLPELMHSQQSQAADSHCLILEFSSFQDNVLEVGNWNFIAACYCQISLDVLANTALRYLPWRDAYQVLHVCTSVEPDSDSHPSDCLEGGLVGQATALLDSRRCYVSY